MEEMYALKQYLYEQTLQIEKQLSRTDRKLSVVVTNNVKGNETKETAGELCDSFEYRHFQGEKSGLKNNSRTNTKPVSNSSDSDEDYPDVMNISHNFTSLMANLENIIGMEPEGLLDEVESIETKLNRLETFMAEHPGADQGGTE